MEIYHGALQDLTLPLVKGPVFSTTCSMYLNATLDGETREITLTTYAENKTTKDSGLK